jgi:FMN reductase (NADPH)
MMGSGENLMIENTVITSMLNRKSVRKYKADKPSDEVVETIVRAGQQAPFASQSYSILLTRKKKAPFGAPLWFIICVDLHKLESFMKVRDWEIVTNDVTLLLFGLQDAAYAAENMVIAAESLGLGSCYLGVMPERVSQIVKQYKLPQRVFPLVELVMGYPDEVFPPRPRYPLSFTLFEDQYPEFTEAQVKDAMQVMDEGYIGWKANARKRSRTMIIHGRSTSPASGDNGLPLRTRCLMRSRNRDLICNSKIRMEKIKANSMLYLPFVHSGWRPFFLRT